MRMITTTVATVAVAAALAFMSAPAMACGECGNYAPESIETGGTLYGGESEYHSFQADRGETMFIELYGYESNSSSGYLEFIVRDEQGRVVLEGDSFADFDFVARREGVYEIEVNNPVWDTCSEYEVVVY